MHGVFQFRRGTAAEWAATNPVLANGELGLEQDTRQLKMGDGVTPWSALTYGGWQGPQGDQGIQGDQGVQGQKGWAPILGVAADGLRRVFQVVDWTGGQGVKPVTGQYISVNGLTADIAAAVDIRGPQGIPGADLSGRVLTAGQGLTGGGSLAADRVFDVVASNPSIVVGEDGIGVGAITDGMHGSLSGGALHALATQINAGFMDPTDKAFIDAQGQGWAVLTDRKFTGGVDIRNNGNSLAVRAALQAAIDSLPLGGVIFVPPGVYNLGLTPFSINRAHIRIVGAARWNTKFTTDSPTEDMFIFAEWFIHIEEVTFSTNVTRTAGWAVNAPPTVAYGRVRRCNVTGAPAARMFNGVRASATLMNVEEMEIRFASGIGVLIDGNSDHQVRGVVMDSDIQAVAGLRVENTASLVVDACNFIHAGVACDISPTGTNTVPSMFFSNNFFDTSDIGLRLAGTGSIFRSKFTSCWFSSHTVSGVHMNNPNVDGMEFVACDFYGNQYGLRVSSARNWSVSHSRVAGNSNTGIAVNPAADMEFRVYDNIVGATAAWGNNVAGIVVNAGTYLSYSIRGNDCSGNNGRPIQDNGTAAVGMKRVYDNVPGPAAQGALFGTVGPQAGLSQTAEQIILNIPIPAYTFQVGTILRLRAFFTNGATASNPTLRIRAGAGAGAITDPLTLATAAITTAASGGYSIDAILVVRGLTQITGSSTASGPAVASTTPAQALVATPTIDAAMRLLLTVSLSAAVIPTLQGATLEVSKP